MWIERIRLTNVKSFEDEPIELSRGINILVGPNNSGKSTMARAALAIQHGFMLGADHRRLGVRDGIVDVDLTDTKEYFNDYPVDQLRIRFSIPQTNDNLTVAMKPGGKATRAPILSKEPQNFIYPYLSKRKVAGFDEGVDESRTSAVTGDLRNLYAKVDRLSNPTMPAYSLYMDACKRILGFVVTCSSSHSGKKACYTLDNFQRITVDSMGEGVSNVLGLLVDLCMAENKLFVIEEPEDDIHPKALKELLRLVAEKSKSNQFIVTTHSNIVVKVLGAEPGTKIFKVQMEFKNKIPTSKIELIQNDPEARRSLLGELGYELIDLDLWEGWLFLEESSAEKIIREYLLPWFAPSLRGKLRTFSARTVDEVERKFDDFNTLFSYLNLQPMYKNRAWVTVDRGEKERGIIEKLKAKYGPAGWNDKHFQQFDKHDFEDYYPEQFQGRVADISSIADDREEKRKRKKDLLDAVEAWTKTNEEEAKAAFEHSAADVIARLKAIEDEMLHSQ